MPAALRSRLTPVRFSWEVAAIESLMHQHSIGPAAFVGEIVLFCQDCRFRLG
jgi:hypothetical protein